MLWLKWCWEPILLNTPRGVHRVRNYGRRCQDLASRTPWRGAAHQPDHLQAAHPYGVLLGAMALKVDLRKAGVGSTSMHRYSQQPTPWASKLRLDHVIHAQQPNNFASKTGSAQTLHVVQLDPTRETTNRPAATSKPRLNAYAQPGRCKRSSPPGDSTSRTP